MKSQNIAAALPVQDLVALPSSCVCDGDDMQARCCSVKSCWEQNFPKKLYLAVTEAQGALGAGYALPRDLHGRRDTTSISCTQCSSGILQQKHSLARGFATGGLAGLRKLETMMNKLM